MEKSRYLTDGRQSGSGPEDSLLNQSGISSRGKNASLSMSRKAILFTLGFFIIALAVMSFAKFLSMHAETEKSSFQEMVILSRMHELDSSAQASIREAFSAYSGFEVLRSNLSITINQQLPCIIEDFSSSILLFKTFAETENSPIRINAEELASEIPLYILPGPAEYSYNQSLGRISISFPEGLENTLSGFSAEVSFSDNISCSWSYTPGSFPLNLEVLSLKESGCSMTRFINPSDPAEIVIMNQADHLQKIILSVDSSSIIIQENSIPSAAIESKLDFIRSPEEAWLGSRVISIDFNEFGFIRNGGIRII